MSGPGVIFKRCGCRDANRRRLEQSCPRLGERVHGTWYFHCSATNLLGRRERARRAGYRSQTAARQARDEFPAGTAADRTAIWPSSSAASTTTRCSPSGGSPACAGS
jgi:hypothetical protein